MQSFCKAVENQVPIEMSYMKWSRGLMAIAMDPPRKPKRATVDFPTREYREN
jgi:hypothetical protein